MQNIRKYFVSGDIKGAISYMKESKGFEEILPSYISLFENEEYLKYDAPQIVNSILLPYQKYFRNVFYLAINENDATEILLSELLALPFLENATGENIAEKLSEKFKEAGYSSLFGKTQGFYGPYVWKETEKRTFSVELPLGTEEYTVNILRGFLMRSFMDYLTFGMFGTSGFATPDGVISCVESAYDFESEKFLVSLLKHEAQHVQDMRNYPGISAPDLEYRAKLVELCYSNDPKLLERFISEADPEKKTDSHAMASLRIKEGFKDCSMDISEIQRRALELFNTDTEKRQKENRENA